MSGCGCLAIHIISASVYTNTAPRPHTNTRSINDSTLEMAQLQDLPRELLDLITTDARQSRQAYKTLANISLTCRRLRAPAQEALHRSIVLTGAGSGHGRRGLAYLVRTLIQRRDLTYGVRELCLSITWRKITHMHSCRRRNPYYGYGGDDDNSCKPYACGWDNVKDLCNGHLNKMRFFTGLKFYDPEWMRLIRQGSQPVMLGVIVACTPRIQHLDLRTTRAAIDSNTNTALSPETSSSPKYSEILVTLVPYRSLGYQG
jgi:hypothetical protein